MEYKKYNEKEISQGRKMKAHCYKMRQVKAS